MAIAVKFNTFVRITVNTETEQNDVLQSSKRHKQKN